jgi:hypothetical protein
LPSLIEHGAEEVHAVGSVGYLEHGLALAERLTAHACTRAFTLALQTLGPLAHTHPVAADDQADLRALASLYLLSQLERASLLPAVELLAKLAISGGISVDLGPASSRLMEFWRYRKEHFSPEERLSLFNRLFDSDFDNSMISLCEALYKLDEGAVRPGASNPLQQAKVRTLAEQLGEHLLEHTSGESAFAANDILATTRAATEILKDSHVEHAFGAHSVWTAVQAILRRYGVAAEEPTSYVVRGKAGLTIIAWLAEARPVLNAANQTLVGLDNPVISAAVDWLSASLAIEQRKAGQPGAAPSSSQPREGA